MTGAQGRDTSVQHHTRSSAAVVLLAITSLLLPLLPAGHAAASSLPSPTPRGADGTIPVVVELDLAAAGGSGLSPAEEAAAGPELVLPAGAVPAIVAQERAAASVQQELPVGRAVAPFQRLPYVATSVTPAEWHALAARPEVAAIGVDEVVETLMDRTLPLIGALPADGEEQVIVGGEAIDGQGRTVAVIDTGINRDHKMFEGVDIDEACFVREENGWCPNETPQQFGEGAAVARGDHGTHVSAIAIGRLASVPITPPIDVRGVAPAADLVAIQTFPEDGGGAFVSDLARAMEWLAGEVEAGNLTTLDAVNLSLGTPPVDTCPTAASWSSFRDAVNDLAVHGVLTIAAAGNDNERTRMGAPACIGDVFSVANARTDQPETLAPSSNVSADTDIAAPGTWVLAASTPGKEAYAFKTGTSMAAPHVAGAAAALRSVYPDAPLHALRTALRATLPEGVVVDDQRDGGVVRGLPLLDLRAAVLAPDLSTVPAPTGVSVAATASTETGGRLEVSWAAAEDATSYRAVAWPTGRSCTASGGDTGCVIEGLPSGIGFRVWVTATDSADQVSTATAGPTEAVSTVTRPEAPENLAVTVERGTGDTLGATVSWSAPFDGGATINGYDLELTPGDDDSVICPEQSISGSDVSCDLASLTEDTVYTVSVTATNVEGQGPAATREFTATDVPAPATDARAEDLGTGGAVQVEWATSTTETVLGYRAELRPIEDPDLPTRTCERGATATTCTVSGLVDGAAYEPAVFAFNGAGDAKPATDTQVTPTGPPGAPQNVLGTRGNGEVEVSWDAPSNDGGAPIATYTVTTTTRGGEEVPAAVCSVTGDTSDRRCTVDGLTNGTAYTFRVQAFNRDKDGDERAGDLSETSADVTPATVPAAPTGVTATASTVGELDVAWQLPSGNGGGTILGSTATAVPTGGGGGTSCDVSGDATACTIDLSNLTADAEFSVTVITTNEVGDSVPSESAGPVLVTAPEPPPPGGGGGFGGGGGGAPPPDPDDDPDADDDAGDGAGDGADPVTDADGSLPAPDAGSTELVIDGSPSTTSASNTITEVAVSGGEVTATLSADDGNGTSSPVRDGTLSLPPGGRVNLGVSGLTPGSTSTAWLFSDPVRLGSLTVGSDGSLSGGVDVPAGVPAGRHTLQLVLERADGTPLALSIGVQVAQIEGRFPDVRVPSTHWLAIERIADLRITLGAADGTYRPGDPVTRGQMAAFLDRQLGLPAVSADTEVALSDIAGTQHEAAIERLVAAGIAGGFTDGTYRPNEPVLRGQLATFLQAAAELAPLASGPATDVAGSTHEQAIHAVMAAEIAGGFTDGTYRPHEDVSRAQMATLLVGLEAFLAE